MRLGQDAGRLHGAAERAAVDGGDAVVRRALGQAPHLPPALVGEVDADRAREAVLGGELGGAVADEVEAGGHGGSGRRGAGAPSATAIATAEGLRRERDTRGRRLAGRRWGSSQRRTPPRMAWALVPRRTPGGRPFSFFVWPPPSIT